MTLVSHCLAQAIDAAVQGNADFRVTLEARDDAGQWFQISWDLFNAAYPSVEEPTKLLSRFSIPLPPYLELSEWRAGEYATFCHGADPEAELVRFIEAYCTQVLGRDATPDLFKVLEA